MCALVFGSLCKSSLFESDKQAASSLEEEVSDMRALQQPNMN